MSSEPQSRRKTDPPPRAAHSSTPMFIAGISVGAIMLFLAGFGAVKMIAGDSSPPPIYRSAPIPPPPPSPHEPTEISSARPTNDQLVARNIASMSGEQLVGALWDLERTTVDQPTFAQLERNADRYSGRRAIFSGEVLEIQDIPHESGSFLRVGIDDYGQRVLAVFTYERPSDEVTRGHRVRAYGALAGSFTYESQARYEITIPRLNAVAVVLTSVPRRARR